MDDGLQHLGRSSRAGGLLKGVVILAAAHLAFAAGMFIGNRILPQPSSDPAFTKALRSQDREILTLKNSVGIPLRRTPEGPWLAESFVTAQQFESLTGTPSQTLQPAERAIGDYPVGNVSFTAAETFCNILTDYERARGILPDGYRYRLPKPGELPTANQGADEWLRSGKKDQETPLFTATAIVEADTSSYAPDGESFPGGWVRWHANLIAGPSGTLQMPRDAAPQIEVSAPPESLARRLTIRASNSDPNTATNLANTAATVIQNECNALAKQRRESEYGFLRAEEESASLRNDKERTELLNLMARYDITDSLDLPSWFLAREDLHDDLGVQNAKNNIERLKKLKAHLADLKGTELPDLSPNPGLSDTSVAYARLYAERKILEVEEAQKMKAGAEDTDPNLVATRAKLARNEEALQVARKSLSEDVDRELKVAENLLIDLEIIQKRRAKEGPPIPPSTEKPKEEAELEMAIAYTDEKLEKLVTLEGDLVIDFALVISDTESPLRGLVPEYLKHRELAKEIEKAIKELDTEMVTLANSPIDPDPPEEPDPEPEPEPAPPEDGTEPAEGTDSDPEDEAKAKEEREAAEEKAEERLEKLTEEREKKLNQIAEARTQKEEQLKAANSDKDVAEEAVKVEIGKLIELLGEIRERDRRTLEYLATKRKYLVGWHRLVELRAELALKKKMVDSPEGAVTIVKAASVGEVEKTEDASVVTFLRGSRAVDAHPDFRNPNLYFRVVLDMAEDRK